MDKIAGVVILYNPDDSVYENVKSYVDQVDKLFVYDNSEKKNISLVEKLKSRPNIIYFDNGENLGVAKILNLAAENATSMGYDFLLTMDQDSKATPKLVNEMLNAVTDIKSIGIITPLHTNKFNTQKRGEKEIEELIVTMTSGNLLNLKNYNVTGCFDENLFIDYVDVEYCLRLKQNNFRIVRVYNAKLFHNEGDLTSIKILGRKIHPFNHPPFRWYYKTRNLFYIYELYKNKFPEHFILEFKIFKNNLLKILLFENHKSEKFKWIIKGYYDYKKKSMGQYKQT